MFAGGPLLADEADTLAGKWTTKKVNDQGQPFIQTIEVKKDKFTFQILSAEEQPVIYAEGELKFEKLGPFKSARFYKIRGGSSSSDLQDVDDEHVVIYTMEGDSWLVASNFDKDRDQKPSIDVYRRAKAPQVGGLVIDEIEMAETPQSATWYLCFEANVDGEKSRHYVENKGYSKNNVTIPLALVVPKAKPGQKCSFRLQLDDIDADVCTDEVDNRSTGEFTVSERGSQTFKPQENWRYTIRWHLK